MKSILQRQLEEKEWKLDLETEKLITGKNQHSVCHSCPTHGWGIYKPLENTCPDCKLYLSGKDIRIILKSCQLEILEAVGKEIEGMIQKNAKCYCKTHPEHNCGITSNETIQDCLKILNQTNEE